MGPDEPNQKDDAGEMHAEIIRRRAREHRLAQRRFARILADRGWSISRISEALDTRTETVARLVAPDGHLICTECIFERHDNCLIETWHDAAVSFTSCECSCRQSRQFD